MYADCNFNNDTFILFHVKYLNIFIFLQDGMWYHDLLFKIVFYKYVVIFKLSFT